MTFRDMEYTNAIDQNTVDVSDKTPCFDINISHSFLKPVSQGNEKNLWQAVYVSNNIYLYKNHSRPFISSFGYFGRELHEHYGNS